VIPEKEHPIKNLIRKKQVPRKSRKARKKSIERIVYGVFRDFRVFRGRFFWRIHYWKLPNPVRDGVKILSIYTSIQPTKNYNNTRRIFL